MGLFNLLANFDPDKVVAKIESAEQALDNFIDRSNKVTDKIEDATDAIHRQAGVTADASPSDDDTSQADDTTESTS